MPDEKTIAQLLIAESITENDLIETEIPNALVTSGYVSRHHSLGVVASFFMKTLRFASDLKTMTKTIIGAINEIYGTELDDTLAAGSTSLVFTDASIVDGIKIDVYVDGGIWYTNLVTDTTNHTCTLTFPAQSAAIDVLIKITRRATS